ncbi:hypothetical protein JKP88DRAFT_279840 [Tribonema minus]|uniref:Uncharacterized protein n=1 Tax=Tribonema minus TaxID=303371 RepID=A0A835Z0U4_9STRA|nr:hypothetical protein JKP88DRAFT_279840 [Tribonema minus]
MAGGSDVFSRLDKARAAQRAYRSRLADDRTTDAWEHTIAGGTALTIAPALPQLAELQEGWRMGRTSL